MPYPLKEVKDYRKGGVVTGMPCGNHAVIHVVQEDDPDALERLVEKLTPLVTRRLIEDIQRKTSLSEVIREQLCREL